MSEPSVFTVSSAPWSLEDLWLIAQGSATLQLSPDKNYRNRLELGAALLRAGLERETPIYGVNTGYGESCLVRTPRELEHELPIYLARFHGCGLGNHLSEIHSAAVVAARLCSLAKGYSGVRPEVLERLVTLVNLRLLPMIPEEGSVGASGDLTPLSYLAAVVMGERQVNYKSNILPAAKALEQAGLQPLLLLPKETLAIMNGTTVMTALSAFAWRRADRLVKLSSHLTALGTVLLRGRRDHFEPRLFALKPHPGQLSVSKCIWSDLETIPDGCFSPSRLQERYSMRCAPHVIGVLADALPWMRKTLEIELNSSNDNPLIDIESGRILHGGHFYGGHVAFAMDGLKAAVASIADLIDRQLALWVSPDTNNGLPANLSGARGLRSTICHGLKAVQIGSSSWTAEALKLTMPAASFSRSTECHNQDKVSMGTHAARDALRILDLCDQVLAAGLIAATQGFHLREREGTIAFRQLTPQLQALVSWVRQHSAFLEEDRELEGDLRSLIGDLGSDQPVKLLDHLLSVDS